MRKNMGVNVNEAKLLNHHEGTVAKFLPDAVAFYCMGVNDSQSYLTWPLQKKPQRLLTHYLQVLFVVFRW